MADKKRLKRLYAATDRGDVVVMVKTGSDENPEYKTIYFDSEIAFKKYISQWREDLDATEKTGLALWAEKMKRRAQAAKA